MNNETELVRLQKRYQLVRQALEFAHRKNEQLRAECAAAEERAIVAEAQVDPEVRGRQVLVDRCAWEEAVRDQERLSEMRAALGVW